jgi:hypothetical protein
MFLKNVVQEKLDQLEEACGPTQDVGAEFLDGEFSEEDVELELSVFTLKKSSKSNMSRLWNNVFKKCGFLRVLRFPPKIKFT